MSSEVFDLADGLEIEQEEALSDDEVRERESVLVVMEVTLFLSLSFSPSLPFSFSTQVEDMMDSTLLDDSSSGGTGAATITPPPPATGTATGAARYGCLLLVIFC